MNVRDVMGRTTHVAESHDSIRHVAEIMKSNNVNAIPVVDNMTLKGIVTDRDIVTRCLAEGHRGCLDKPVEHVMTKKVYATAPHDDLEDAAHLMGRRGVRCLPVVQHGLVVGVLSYDDVVRAHGLPFRSTLRQRPTAETKN